MKHKFILIVILIIVSLFVSCKSNEKESNVSTLDTKCMYDWVSPDGVHYWVYAAGYKGAMSPRYDRNGNLVVEKN